MRFLRSLPLLALIITSSANAQTGTPVVITSPNTVNASGQSVKVTDVFVRNADGTIAALSGGGGGGGGAGVDPRVAQGSTTAGQTGTLGQCATVSGNQTYAVGTTNPLNCITTGRLKVGVSSAGNIDPAAQLTTTLTADLLAGKYYANRPTWSDGYTGALQVDQFGNLYVNAVGLPSSLGAKSSAGSLSITPASDAVFATTTSNGATSANQATQITAEQAIAAAAGSTADATYTGTGSATLDAILKGIYAVNSGPTPAGSAVIGRVGIDQTTPGTSNAVTLNDRTGAAFGTSTNPIYVSGGTGGGGTASAVAISQTTPGSTNNVTTDGVTDAYVVNLTASSAAVMVPSAASAQGQVAAGGIINTAGYASLSFQYVSGGNTMTVEGSNSPDFSSGATNLPVTIASSPGNPNSGVTGASTVSLSTAGATYIPMMVMPYMRIRISTYSSGTTTIALGMKRASRDNLVTLAGGNATVNLGGGTQNIGNAALGAQATAPGSTFVTAAASSVSLKTTSGNLYGMNVINGATAGYVLALNLNAAPTSGATIAPATIISGFAVAANASVGQLTDVPMAASSGIQIVFSSSTTTYTPVTPLTLTGYYK